MLKFVLSLLFGIFLVYDKMFGKDFLVLFTTSIGEVQKIESP